MEEKKKILIAESEQIIAADLQMMLENAGHTVIATALTGEETIEKVKELKPDIIILDIYLDGEIDGKTAAKKIKEFSDSKIMFYSTSKDKQSIKEKSTIDSSSLLFNLDEEKQIASNVEKIISNEKLI